MDLEWFVNNTRNKQIRISSVHTDGRLGMSIYIIILDAEIKRDKYCNQLLINDSEIRLYFDDYKICDEEDCKDILYLYRNGQSVIEIRLPNEESWDNPEIVGYVQY